MGLRVSSDQAHLLPSVGSVCLELEDDPLWWFECDMHMIELLVPGQWHCFRSL